MTAISGFAKRWPVFLAGAAVATAATTYAGVSVRNDSGVVAPVGVVSSAIPASFADLAQRVRPAVVFISTESTRSFGARIPRMPPGFFPFPFERFGERPVTGVGSGFIVDKDGLIVTNHHVIDGASEVTVTLDDGSKHSAEVVGTDPKTDLAVLKIDAGRTLPTVRFGDSDDTRVGDWVVAVGNPFGLGGSVSAGVVSARGRDIQSGPYDDYLQFDASINRGNSGGPLFNTRGEVIGVNTAIYSPSGGNVGIGFAVPAALAEPVVASLEAHGQVDRGWIGIRVQGVTPALAESLSLQEAEGALVTAVEPDSPADKAGIKRGDVIVSVERERVERMRDAVRAIGSHPNRAKIDLEIIRDGKSRTLTATLASPPASLAQKSTTTEKTVPRGRLGVQLADVSKSAAERWEIEPGTAGAVIVGVAPDSPAAQSKLRPGDVIVSVNREPVEDAQAVARAIGRHDAERPVLLLVQRAGVERYLAIKLG